MLMDKTPLRCRKEQAGLWNCTDLTWAIGYLYSQSVMRTAAIVLDIEECFHTGARELLVIRAQGVS